MITRSSPRRGAYARLQRLCQPVGTLLLFVLAGCAHQPKQAENAGEAELISTALLADTNAPPGSVYSTKIYVIQAGDYLTRIAADFGTTVRELKRLNPSLKTSRLFLGQRIRVAEEQSPPTLDEPERLKKAEAQLTAEQQAHLQELSLKVKTGNSVADINRLKDSLSRWDELFITPAPAELKPVYAILKERVRERLAELELEAKLTGGVPSQ